MHNDEIRRLRRAHQKGKSVAALARLHQCCEATVEKFIMDANPSQPLSEGELKAVIARLAETQSLAKACKVVGLTFQPLKKLLLPHKERVLSESGYDVLKPFGPKVRFTPEMLADILKRFNEGTTQLALATEYNLSITRIQQLLKKARGLR